MASRRDAIDHLRDKHGMDSTPADDYAVAPRTLHDNDHAGLYGREPDHAHDLQAYPKDWHTYTVEA